MDVPSFEPPFLPMPRLGLGTWPMKGAECQAAVESALAMGYRHLDTAEMYGNEDAVGAGMAASGVPRGEIFLTTKVWNDKTDGAAVRAALHASLERLKTPYLDLYLVHWPSPAMQLESILGALAEAREEGLARHVGVANFPRGLMVQAVEANVVPIACLQVEHHVFLSQRRLLEWCRPRGIALTSYTPVAKGQVAEEPEVLRVAAKHGVTPGQVALAYLLAMPGVAAIPKAAGAERQQENLGALDVVLDPDDLAALSALPKDRRLVNPGMAPDWDA